MSQIMRALVKREAAEGIWMEEVPIPSPGTNEVLIKVEKTAICGTDLHIYLWDDWAQRTIKPGLVIGHVRVPIAHDDVLVNDVVWLCHRLNPPSAGDLRLTHTRAYAHGGTTRSPMGPGGRG